MDACIQASLFAGEFARVEEEKDKPEQAEHDADEARFWTRKKSPWSAEVDGFDVHAGVTIRAGDRAGLERLCRYAARAPVALARLSLLEDGRVAYRLRKPRRNGATHLVMTPIELLAKVASLVPPPKRPLLRLSGVLGPKSSWRASVVPRATHRAQQAHTRTGCVVDKLEPPAHAESPSTNTLGAADELEPPAPAKTVGVVDKIAHAGDARTGLGSGVVRGKGARISFAALLKRVFLEDVLACPCGGRRRILGDVDERSAVVKILSHLGLPTDGPPIARARDPADFELM